MCGIVGIVNKRSGGFGVLQKDVFEDLLIADGVRGMDSTGAFMVTGKNQVDILKQACEPGMFIRTRSFKDFRDSMSRAQVVVGHNRKATSGEIITKNAHPFIRGHIVLVHNGFIGNSKSIDASVDVDSEAIATALNKSDNHEEALDRLWGAWSLAWYNHKLKKLYLARNSERPMSICHTDDALYFASEPEMLTWIMARHKIRHQSVTETKAGTVYTIDWKNFDISSKELPARSHAMTVWPQNRVMHVNSPEEGDHCVDPIAFQADFEPQTVLGPDGQFDPTERTKNIDALVGAIRKQYPEGSQVLFEPKGMSQPNASGEVNVYGYMWIPGKPVYRGIYVAKPRGDKEWYLPGVYPAPLEAAVMFWQRRGQSISCQLNRLRAPGEILKDSNGQYMSHFEWYMICEHIGCGKCAHGPKTHQPEFTTINRSAGEYNVVCAMCITGGSKKGGDKQVPLDDKEASGKPSVNDSPEFRVAQSLGLKTTPLLPPHSIKYEDANADIPRDIAVANEMWRKHEEERGGPNGG